MTRGGGPTAVNPTPFPLRKVIPRMSLTDPRDALVLTMVLASAADGDMTDAEMTRIGMQLQYLPAFAEWGEARFEDVIDECLRFFDRPDGLNAALEHIKSVLPHHLRETAYAVACDMVAADGKASQEELRVLELMRHVLDIGRLQASAIEYGTRARSMTV